MYIIALLLTNLYCKGPQKMAKLVEDDNTSQNKQTTLLVGRTPPSVLTVFLLDYSTPV